MSASSENALKSTGLTINMFFNPVDRRYQLHKEEHFNFSNKTMVYRNKVMGGDTKIACEILEYLKKWLVEHIQVTDRKYIDCFEENGLK